MATKKRSVGLVVLTEVPAMGTVAVLRRRGKINPEKDDFRESYPGGCQVTCHGRAEEGESIEDALLREAKEELGHDFAHGVLMPFIVRGGLNVLVDHEGEDEDIKTFGIFIPGDQIRKILQKQVRLESSSGGLEFLPQNEIGIIGDLKNFDKEPGVPFSSVIAMFSDEIEAVRRAFEKLVPAT